MRKGLQARTPLSAQDHARHCESLSLRAGQALSTVESDGLKAAEAKESQSLRLCSQPVAAGLSLEEEDCVGLEAKLRTSQKALWECSIFPPDFPILWPLDEIAE